MYGPSLCRLTLLWAEFAMGRVCYGPRCPVTSTLFFSKVESEKISRIQEFP